MPVDDHAAVRAAAAQKLSARHILDCLSIPGGQPTAWNKMPTVDVFIGGRASC
jgi:hypothetical protein